MRLIKNTLSISVLFSLSVTTALFAQFTPNDPYFLPDVAGNVTAAGYYGQWHLVNNMPVSPTNAGLDVKISEAWARGLTGNGVVISIIDDGTQSAHPDLSPGFQNAYSWDYSLSASANWASSHRGSPVSPADNHGTSVAGVAAARGGNGIGVTGAAPFAGIAAQRFLTGGSYYGNLTETQAEILAVGFQGQTDGGGNPDPTVPFTGPVANVRIMNHSYGPNSGFGADVDSSNLLTALNTSAGLNVIHVFSAGNQRGEWSTADTGKIFASNSPDVIVVAAVGSNGKFSDYSSYGAAVMVSAPSSSRDPTGQFQIATTDRTGLDGYNNINAPHTPTDDTYFQPPASGDLGNYTSSFGGTSSAAPLVSGIMALGVEANNAMNLRMARHLLARTSTKVDPSDADWITNAAGYNFNKNYGFGMIDADAFTLNATLVTSMTALQVHQSPETTVNLSFSPSTTTLSQVINISLTDPLPIEFVQISLAITNLQDNLTDYNNGFGALIGDISGILTSPSGTTYDLFSDDRFLVSTPDEGNRDILPELQWTFTSYAYFGENVNGNWTITLNNTSPNANATKFGTWDTVSITLGMGDIAIIPEPKAALMIVIASLGFAVFRRRIPGASVDNLPRKNR